MSASTIPSFAARDIQQLVSGYAQDNLQQWGHVGLFEYVLGQDPYINAIHWAIDELAAQLVCVINANSTAPMILRIIVTPDFLWAGIHAVPLRVASKSTPSHVSHLICQVYKEDKTDPVFALLVPLEVYARFLEDALLQSPLTSGVLAIRSLNFQEEWMAVQNALFGHLGPPEGSPAAIIAEGGIPPACRDVPDSYMITIQVPSLPPLPPNNDPHYGGTVRVTGRDGLEVPRKNWRY
ncbi:uncharacterized protein N7496_007809 [Penicillium cataractarum]|uniref:Uncharacterized protein n=1 Tax=Penicillium cataractarum TaxID=2100454 RepID=A0A9W9V547_9EURO|nr:uncharacterized protein N7496_007809 [Penicillium cataractarum]KAJ5368049.1 hypothetical protein N7496_007809 [Penicillium cataractarum]